MNLSIHPAPAIIRSCRLPSMIR